MLGAENVPFDGATEHNDYHQYWVAQILLPRARALN